MVKGGDEKERDKQTLKHSRLQGERDRKKKVFLIECFDCEGFSLGFYMKGWIINMLEARNFLRVYYQRTS